ncbi:hypothetical protein LXA43DRAFT_1097889 [Ganoderma leucocontextum]|nr:hypothetical protein LXA43DRAFT_1097889 [Ganoderma leucocontextum]
MELQTLIDAWVTGATCFRVMGEEEFRAWRCKRQGIEPPRPRRLILPCRNAPMPSALSSPTAPQSGPNASATLPSTGAITQLPLPPTTASAPVAASNPPPNAITWQTMFVNVNIVTGADGNSIAVSTQPRKTRSDKGTRKTKKTPAQVNAQAAAPSTTAASTSTTPPSVVPKSRKKAKKAAVA